MSKINIKFSVERSSSPLSFWVHKALDSDIWDRATKFDPPMPMPVVGKGYPIYEIEYRGHVLYFCSNEEIEHCIDILSEKVLPTTQSLAKNAGHSGYQHLHWLTKWPGDIKSWKDRQAIIKSLKKLVEKAT